MKIELRLYATLSALTPQKTDGDSCEIEVAEGTTVRNLLEALKVPRENVKLVFLNGVHANGDEILRGGDRVGVFPAVAGG